MQEAARRRKAPRSSGRRSFRSLRRRRLCSQALVRSMTQRLVPNSLPCLVRRLARLGRMPQSRSFRRCSRES